MEACIILRRLICLDCFSRYEPETLEGREIYLTPEKLFVDAEGNVIGCVACLKDYPFSRHHNNTIVWSH